MCKGSSQVWVADGLSQGCLRVPSGLPKRSLGAAWGFLRAGLGSPLGSMEISK